MDRALKERTIGAVVLVAFAVLVVPVFLDGPSNESDTVSETVTLPGQNDQPRKQQTIVLERDRTEPVPAAQLQEAPRAAVPEAVPVTTAAPARKTPAAPDTNAADKQVEPKSPPASRNTATAPPENQSVTGMWAVQLGSFSNRANAERLAAELRDGGYAAFLSQLDTANGELHRVRIGPQKDRNAAESVAQKLTNVGHKGQVVPHP